MKRRRNSSNWVKKEQEMIMANRQIIEDVQLEEFTPPQPIIPSGLSRPKRRRLMKPTTEDVRYILKQVANHPLYNLETVAKVLLKFKAYNVSDLDEHQYPKVIFEFQKLLNEGKGIR